MHNKRSDCLFCGINENQIILENRFAFAVYDGFPVTQFHSLIIPKRHVSNYFDLTPAELLACNLLLRKLENQIREQDSSVDGFNVGINVGEVAGQTIFHRHIHLIPRRKKDVPNPKGGVRHVIPGKEFY